MLKAPPEPRGCSGLAQLSRAARNSLGREIPSEDTSENPSRIWGKGGRKVFPLGVNNALSLGGEFVVKPLGVLEQRHFQSDGW